MYKMQNNKSASKYDIFFQSILVASLHYEFDAFENEVTFHHCEPIEDLAADAHCRELMKRAIKDVRKRWLRVNITCPIALKYLEKDAS